LFLPKERRANEVKKYDKMLRVWRIDKIRLNLLGCKALKAFPHPLHSSV